ncbi:hypothetical protein FYJ34_06635 [Clostridiaceae bacterium 68-1-5]|uniref:Uncharacterized protein n=1 Tax=Suipraeoptans intestinalis TaxID=2606628 RepID=A0A6N7V237_9FIRM|nr:hypothetical protein [Suipraeoptans intestinalis]MSR93936.1 hypothetical protein [Suipraeoptans intestinalis]
MEREVQMRHMFEELTGYESRDVKLKMDGYPASPMQIVQAHMLREETVYMRDYILDERGNVKELCFHRVTNK